MESTLVPVRGRPTMIHGALDALVPDLGMLERPALELRCGSQSAEASILEMRRRPKVVSSASFSQARRNTSSGSR